MADNQLDASKSMDRTRVRAMTAQDWPVVSAIYQAGIDDGHATFETEPPAWGAFDASKLVTGRLVAEQAGAVLGWTALSPVSLRRAYRGVVESSVYVASAARGRGVGHTLLSQLVSDSQAAGIWTIQANIFPENTASLALYERLGFRIVGRRERISTMTLGPLAGTWRDTVLVEHRSP